jgi:hypothetical protein
MIDPTQAAGQMPAQAPQQGAAVCIAPQGDGTFSVYPEGQQDAGQPAQDIDAALDAARQLLSGGASQVDPKGADAQAEALFKGGFSEHSGRPPVGNN